MTTDRIDTSQAIQRLDALRTAGTITDAEYAAEIAKLVQKTSSPAPDAQASSIKFRRWATAGAIAAALVGGAVFLGRRDGRSDHVANAVAQQSVMTNGAAAVQANESMPKQDDEYPLAPNWAFRSANNPMTDLVTNAAFSRFATPLGYANVTIACNGNKDLAYQFAAFDNAGEGAPLRTEYGGNMNVGMHESSAYILRIDNGEPLSLKDRDLRFNNAIHLSAKQENTPLQSMAAQAARGRRLAVQLQLEAGDVTIVMDQGMPKLRTLLDSCLSGMVADEADQERKAVARCEAGNASIRKNALAARAAYKARNEPIPGYIGDEGTPIKADDQGNGIHDCRGSG